MTHAVARLSSPEQAIAAAHQLAKLWSENAASIDAQRRIPIAELQALAQSGLLAITVPKEFGGAGVNTQTLIEVFLILAQADTALAQIPQNHFDFVDTLLVAPPDTRAYFYQKLLEGARFGNALAEPDRPSRRDIATTIHQEGDGFRLNGRKYFSTGALTAQWVPVFGKAPDGRILTAYIERDNPGLEILTDWDAFGQRATYSGTTLLKDVWIPARQVVDRSQGDRATEIAQFAGNQLIHAAIEAGSARGIINAAAALLQHHTHPRSHDLARLGEYHIRLLGVETLVRHAAQRVDAVLNEYPIVLSDRPDEALSIQALHEYSPAIAQACQAFIATDEAKSLAYELSPALANDIVHLQVLQVSNPHRGLDRLWRNVRTHSLHDPVRWRQFYVGNFYLNGLLPNDIALMAHKDNAVVSPHD